ncbi:hypothetical protein EG68_00766 [Paragonimus skrjabini miyazakii]|uniref:Uncharacterized protein n=1 Tax=Paragonimus skrjabini miyazakii TaxID=59628 RepID=A0A8S9ZC48_9TREM|nr:hypothetical protein EG68_00766 [Paragonimus skrjabini miyazakii]
MKSKAFAREVEVDEKQFKNIEYPPSCCKHIDVSIPKECPAIFNSKNSNIEHGCSNIVSNVVEHLLSPVVYGSLVIPAVEIFLLVVAILVAKHLEKSAEQPAVWNRTYN